MDILITHNYDLIADTYLRAFRENDIQFNVAAEIDKISKDPSAGLKLVETLIAKTMNDAEIAYVAAGPLEDLFMQYAEEISTPLDQLLKNDLKMRKAITGIWIRDNVKARAALDKLLNKYHLKYASL